MEGRGFSEHLGRSGTSGTTSEYFSPHQNENHIWWVRITDAYHGGFQWHITSVSSDSYWPSPSPAETFKSMEAFVVSSYSHSQWQLYLPSSFLVTLKTVRMNSCLHLLRVFFAAMPYFSLLVKGVRLLSRYQRKSSGQPLSSLSIKHVRLTLENLLAEIIDEETVGLWGNGPVLKREKKIF